MIVFLYLERISNLFSGDGYLENLKNSFQIFWGVAEWY